jgi:hypothetical protein
VCSNNRLKLAQGLLLLVFVHGGEGELHADEFLGLPVSIDTTLFQPEGIAGYARQAGFLIDKITTREPYTLSFRPRASTSRPGRRSPADMQVNLTGGPATLVANSATRASRSRRLRAAWADVGDFEWL